MTNDRKVLWSAYLLLKEDGADLQQINNQLCKAFTMTRGQLAQTLRSCQREIRQKNCQAKIQKFFKDTNQTFDTVEIA
jgi:hypothetical protein